MCKFVNEDCLSEASSAVYKFTHSHKYKIARLAQLVERPVYTGKVQGSSP